MVGRIMVGVILVSAELILGVLEGIVIVMILGGIVGGRRR